MPPSSLNRLNGQLKGNRIWITGCGSFVDEEQPTVFLRCDGSKLREVWHKFDYGYNPHITLFDVRPSEPALEKARQIEGVVSRFNYKVSFEADRLAPLVSRRSHHNLELSLAQDLSLFAKLVQRRVTTEGIAELPFAERLSMASKLCAQLAGLSDAANRQGGRTRDHRHVLSQTADRLVKLLIERLGPLGTRARIRRLESQAESQSSLSPAEPNLS